MSTKFGSFEELLADTEEGMRPIARALKDMVLEIDPGTVEVVRLGDRAATFGVGPKKMSEGYVYILPYKQWVNLGFYKGAALDDPEGLLEGTGAKMRHVKIRDPEQAASEAVKALVREAIAERRASLGLDD